MVIQVAQADGRSNELRVFLGRPVQRRLRGGEVPVDDAGRQLLPDGILGVGEAAGRLEVCHRALEFSSSDHLLPGVE